MKIINLTHDSKIYTSNVFLVLGTWNASNDVNTLIDVGNDPAIFQKIEDINTGLGKQKINQVLITHSHSDHTAILPAVKDIFNPKVYAFNAHLKGVTHLIHDGDVFKIGDACFEAFHITAHSYDSICLFCESEGILFSGDTSFPIKFENHTLSQGNAAVLQRLGNKHITIVYPGHGPERNFTVKQFQLMKDKPNTGCKSAML